MSIDPAIPNPDANLPTQSIGGAAAQTSRLGPYKLLQKIGEGGMGEVWMAEQEQPVRRRVAIKLIKAGLDSKQVIARFEAERQALAMMDHPNIAKVLDVGTTAAGLPYVVMELVQGIPITKYCDRNRLSFDERLKLFISICNAAQHAHQKGIIHRDLKPSNVLVTVYDGKPVPKIIDFGLVKALQHLTPVGRRGIRRGRPVVGVANERYTYKSESCQRRCGQILLRNFCGCSRQVAVVHGPRENQ